MKQELIDDALSVLKEAEQAGARLSFSGGADSAVMHHLIQSNGIKINKLFTSMGVEGPHNVKIIKEIMKDYDDVVKAKPKKSYKQLVYEYGFPIKNKEFSDKAYKIRNAVINNKVESGVFKTIMYNLSSIGFDKLGKIEFNLSDYSNYFANVLKPRYYYLVLNYPIQNQCCNVLKKQPSKQTHDKVIIGIMSDDSRVRRQMIEENFNADIKTAFYPLRNWTKKDVFEYAREYEDCLISESYHERDVDGVKIQPQQSTGCLGCHYGNTVGHFKKVDGELIKTTKLDLLSIEFPRLYDNVMGMQSHTGHTYGEVVKIAEESLEFKYLKESIELIKPILKQIRKEMKRQGYGLEAKRFKEVMKYIIKEEIKLAKRKGVRI